jgi:flagellar basal body-associated protein FliL
MIPRYPKMIVVLALILALTLILAGLTYPAYIARQDRADDNSETQIEQTGPTFVESADEESTSSIELM